MSSRSIQDKTLTPGLTQVTPCTKAVEKKWNQQTRPAAHQWGTCRVGLPLVPRMNVQEFFDQKRLALTFVFRQRQKLERWSLLDNLFRLEVAQLSMFTPAWASRKTLANLHEPKENQ